ncbi:hypothetical protein Tco_0267935 [Tanacetum coccineum]
MRLRGRGVKTEILHNLAGQPIRRFSHLFQFLQLSWEGGHSMLKEDVNSLIKLKAMITFSKADGSIEFHESLKTQIGDDNIKFWSEIELEFQYRPVQHLTSSNRFPVTAKGVIQAEDDIGIMNPGFRTFPDHVNFIRGVEGMMKGNY